MINIGIYASKEMNDLRELAARISTYPTTVLIEGETGVGKEIMSNYIHHTSPRANKPFIKINCGAIPEGLMESELFGYERGAFTGANREGSPGLFEQAHMGTILLDEISELSYLMQVKVLRVLQDREVRRVGGSWSKVIDVRIIASTNQNLKKLVDQGKFREDLYYRLNVAYLYMPPLRKRRDDIEPLIQYFLDMYCKEFGIQRWFNNESIEVLKSYNYSGNIRELRNIIEVACITSQDEEIGVHALPNYLLQEISSATGAASATSLAGIVEEAECNAIQAALKECKSIRQSAKQLDISNATILRKIKKYNLKIDD